MKQSWKRQQVKAKAHPSNVGQESYYDLFDDWELIESSFLKQYGIRIRRSDDDMSWTEFCSLIAGLMHDTPLGQIVSIRAEKDPKVIKDFSSEQKRIRNEWITRRNKKLKEDPVAYKKYMDGFQAWCKASFS